MRMGPVMADASDKTCVLPFNNHWQRVAVLCRIVPDLKPWKLRKDLAGAAGTHRLFCFCIDGNGMRGEDRDAHRGRRNREVWLEGIGTREGPFEPSKGNASAL